MKRLINIQTRTNDMRECQPKGRVSGLRPIRHHGPHERLIARSRRKRCCHRLCQMRMRPLEHFLGQLKLTRSINNGVGRVRELDVPFSAFTA